MLILTKIYFFVDDFLKNLCLNEEALNTKWFKETQQKESYIVCRIDDNTNFFY